MKTALVLGVSGGFGRYMALNLLEQGWRVKVLMRSPAKIPRELLGKVQIIKGDAKSLTDLSIAARGCEALIYGINLPYKDWHERSIPLLNTSLSIAQQFKLTFLFPGNVYVYDPKLGPYYFEGSEKKAVTKKGAIRIEMEAMLHRASDQGLHVILIRAGDFIGKDIPSSWMNYLIKKHKTHYELTTPGPLNVSHTWAFLPDLCKQATNLLENSDQAEGKFQDFHFAGHSFTFSELKRAIQTHTGKPVKVKKFPWWLIKLLSLISQPIKEVREIKYLWFKQMDLKTSDNQKKSLPMSQHTSLISMLTSSNLI